jgi:enolase
MNINKIIENIEVRQIFDSRGEPTIEVEIMGEGGKKFLAQVPSGKSRGSREATVFSFSEALISIATIRRAVIGRAFSSLHEFDGFLKKEDGTEEKSKLGGNVILGASIAFGRLIADVEKKELWEVLREEFFSDYKKNEQRPSIFSNVINGGVHANNNLDIQEYMVVARPKHSYTETIARLEKFYKHLGVFLRDKHGGHVLPLGDEGGYSVDFKNNFEPIHILQGLIIHEGLSESFSIGLDIAASGLFEKDSYRFEGEHLSQKQLHKVYEKYFKDAELLCSIEDPFDESDEKGFLEIKNTLGEKWVVGDDFTVTSPKLIQEYGAGNFINAVIIKPNQIGSVSEACEAIRIAHDIGLKTIVSHRSGETEDVFIIHLAKAGNVRGVKIGAPVKERILKFNELIRLFD